MAYTETRNEAGEYLRLTLKNIMKYNLSANPVNYTVWYEYVAGKNLKLRRAIDSAVKKNDKPFNDKKLEDLYKKYITDGDRIVIGKILTKISLMLKDITSHVSDTEGDLAGHGNNLETLADQINEVHDYNDIRNVVDQMIVETKALVKSGKKLQTRMKISADDLKQLHMDLEKSQQEAQTDALTSLINRRGLKKQIEIEKIRAKQNNSSFSIILADIDHFKKINDNFGHLVGDSVLKSLAALFKQHLRQNDIAVRYGGEEFLLLLPETKLEGAIAVAEKIKKALSRKEWQLKATRESMGKITISMGIALYKLNEPEKLLIKRADDALYLAKEKGRDRIISENEI